MSLAADFFIWKVSNSALYKIKLNVISYFQYESIYYEHNPLESFLEIKVRGKNFFRKSSQAVEIISLFVVELN